MTRKKKATARKKSPGRPRKTAKKTLNVDGMSLRELKKLEDELQKAKAEARERVKRDLRAKIDSLLDGTGLTVFDIYGSGGAKRRGKASSGVAKYANPDDPSDTWTGRGRKPNWLVARLKKGANLEQFAI